MAALRHNQGKAPLHYVRTMPKALYALARVFEQGAIKYAPGNWQKGGKPDAEYLDSADRHLTALVNGEWFDQDTGCSHAAHVMWNMGALIQMNYPDEADRDPFFDQAGFEARYRGDAPVPHDPAWPYGRPNLGAGEHNPVLPERGSVADLARPSTQRWDRNTVDL